MGSLSGDCTSFFRSVRPHAVARPVWRLQVQGVRAEVAKRARSVCHGEVELLRSGAHPLRDQWQECVGVDSASTAKALAIHSNARGDQRRCDPLCHSLQRAQRALEGLGSFRDK
jgi:hypothetical protein